MASKEQVGASFMLAIARFSGMAQARVFHENRSITACRASS